jgi:predicted nucleic acid-binding protein
MSAVSNRQGFPGGPLLFDTGIYIRYLRGEKYEWLGADAQIFQRTILTAVVASELYAGTRTRAEKRALDNLCRAHESLGHFCAPPARAWTETGMLLRRGGERWGRLDFVAHFRDVLIAMEAMRTRSTLLTENVADFTRWKTLLGRAGKALRIFTP